MKELQSILLNYLQKVYSISEEQAAELLYKKTEDGKVDKENINEELLTQLLDKDKERVKSLQDGVDTSKKFEEGYNKAKKETLEKFEKKLRKEHGVEDEKLTGADLIKHIIESKVESEPSKLTEDDVKKHPLYLQLEKEKTTEVEKLTTDFEKKIEDIETGFQKSQTLKDLKEQAILRLDARNPVLPKDAVAASNQKNLFANLFDQYEYQKDGDKTLVLKDGKRLEDEHGNPVYYEQLVDQTADKYFEFQKQGAKGSAGNEGGAGGGLNVPKNEEEFNKAYFEANTPEERQELQEAWDAANPE